MTTHAETYRLHQAEACRLIGVALERAELDEIQQQVESEPVEVDPSEAWEPVGPPLLQVGSFTTMPALFMEAAAVHAQLALAASNLISLDPTPMTVPVEGPPTRAHNESDQDWAARKAKESPAYTCEDCVDHGAHICPGPH